MTIKNGQARETANIGRVHKTQDKQHKNTTQFVLDTTIHKHKLHIIRHSKQTASIPRIN